ncbi:hypothetical protein [Acinetobacter baumannii]|uniref:phosphoribosyltransferase-like protein n=1 Tax=Acinetobacter baumannii TaxID=470 RepID=UPI0018DC2B7E|nr:hypothetical protein [Acinetobacter baumannii]MBH8491723.1 hypothetical protein [Acinetobacter baumannii]
MIDEDEIERHLRISKDMWSDLVMLQSWPQQRYFNTQGWVQNFRKSEIPYALRLIDNMTYYSDEMSKALFKSAFHRLCKIILQNETCVHYNQASINWQTFKNSAYIIPISGETPNPSDSGFRYARYARDLCKIEEANILSLEQAIRTIQNGRPAKLIFVDDFLGSGEQFLKTWSKKFDIGGSYKSLANSVCSNSRIEIYICTIISTQYAIENIHQVLPNAVISPAHIFTPYHSVLSEHSYIWRDDMKTEGPQFIQEISSRLGIPDLNGELGENDEICWRGFKKLGLCVAFQDSIPDASIPLLNFSSEEWQPLIRIG